MERNKNNLSTLDIKEAEAKCHSSELEELGKNVKQLIFSKTRSDDLWCPKVWDGLLCWPATPAGGLVSLPCPKYFYGFDPGKMATRKCDSEGTWYWREDLNSTWTNYTQCFENDVLLVPTPPPDLVLKYIPLVRTISTIGYTVSLITLIVAFSTLAFFKGLWCPRNKLHMNLFMSFMFRACCTLIVINASTPLETATSAEEIAFLNLTEVDWTGCRVITSLWIYFLLANYCWILMEGLYLHNLIFLALFIDSSSIILYIILGWGLPIPFVVLWIFIRISYENTFCWRINRNPYYSLIIKVPIAVSVLVSFGLFLNIVRDLLLKIQAPISEENKKFRKWAKSTMMLVPLFGVHYAIFIGMSFVEGFPELELIWLFGDQLFGSFQGFFVAVLYCFLNAEVRTKLQKKWRRQQGISHNSPSKYSILGAALLFFYLVFPGIKKKSNVVQPRGFLNYNDESGSGAEPYDMPASQAPSTNRKFDQHTTKGKIYNCQEKKLNRTDSEKLQGEKQKSSA